MTINTLRDSMLALYRDDDQIYSALLGVDWSSLNQKYKEELFARIDEKDYYVMDSLLHSDEYANYANAINQAALACTQQLADLILLANHEGTQQ